MRMGSGVQEHSRQRQPATNLFLTIRDVSGFHNPEMNVTTNLHSAPPMNRLTRLAVVRPVNGLKWCVAMIRYARRQEEFR